MKGFEHGFGGGEHFSGPTVEAEPQSPLLTEPNFKDMCGKAGTTPQQILKFLANGGAEGVAGRKYLEQLITEYTEKHPQQEHILKGGALAVGRAVLRRARIEEDVVSILENIALHAEEREDAHHTQ